jgi:hypothetical protein
MNEMLDWPQHMHGPRLLTSHNHKKTNLSIKNRMRKRSKRLESWEPGVSGIETRLTHKPVAIIDPFSVISADIFSNKTKNAENNYSPS